jgi:hypothetical protein
LPERSRGALVVAVAGALSACSLLTSFDGLTGGAGDAGPRADTGASPADARDDTTSDAAVDAPADTDWCAVHAPNAFFCHDLENGDLTRFAKGQQTNGTVARDDAAAVSVPFSLLVRTNAVASGGGATSTYVSTARAQAADATLSFDFRSDKTPMIGQGMDIAQLNVYGASTTWNVGVTYENGGALSAYYYDQKSSTYKQIYVGSNPLKLGAWVHIRLHHVIAPDGTATVDIDVDAAPIVSSLVVPATVPAGSPTDAYLGGVFCRAPNDGRTLRFDDIVLELK